MNIGKLAVVALAAFLLPMETTAQTESGGIQWYSTLESARQVATKTGRPILFLSAAPHCGGVSGVW